MIRRLALATFGVAAWAAPLPTPPSPHPAPLPAAPLAMARPLCSWRTSDGGWVTVVCTGNYCTATRYDKSGNVVYTSDDANPGWC